MEAMLFHLTTEDQIRVMNEGPGDRDAGDSTFASEQELHELASRWAMKRLVEIWNRLPILLPFKHTQPDTDLLLLPKRAMAY
jgi:hypothetical protein